MGSVPTGRRQEGFPECISVLEGGRTASLRVLIPTSPRTLGGRDPPFHAIVSPGVVLRWGEDCLLPFKLKVQHKAAPSTQADPQACTTKTVTLLSASLGSWGLGQCP
ncbi:Hypothetical predicted protein [Marmota monax]|uniref:Uncharacterized protein n=1 Tax=Marmota monax TaxID=9995 RepID=A0A5E4BEI2_MARMO|nr:hypothetical protein GHT09_007012 [Marmota monax]VTJ67052.1 Hypothetical predicted protein [Marmota monax]